MASDFSDEDWKWARENPEQYKAMLRFKAQQRSAARSSVQGYSYNGARIGDLVRFSYQNAPNFLLSQGQKPISSRRPNEHLNPTVLVLHNNWTCGNKKLGSNWRCFHGLNWDLLSRQEQQYLRGVMNPMFAAQMSATDKEFARRIDQVNKVSAVSITSPHDFYTKCIQPFIRSKGWEPYRRYRIALIKNISVVLTREIMSGAENDTLYRSAFRKLDALRGPNF